MKTWFFGPTYSANTGIIKNIDLSLNAPGIGITIADANANNTDSNVSIKITPGQDANGNAVSTSSFYILTGWLMQQVHFLSPKRYLQIRIPAISCM